MNIPQIPPTPSSPRGSPTRTRSLCTGCPWNTGNQGQLSDGAPKGKCCNTPCSQKKTDLFLEEYPKEQAVEHPGLQYLGQQTRAPGRRGGGHETGGYRPGAHQEADDRQPGQVPVMVSSPGTPGTSPPRPSSSTDRRILEASGNRAPSAANSDSRERPGFPGKERSWKGLSTPPIPRPSRPPSKRGIGSDFTEAQGHPAGPHPPKTGGHQREARPVVGPATLGQPRPCERRRQG